MVLRPKMDRPTPGVYPHPDSLWQCPCGYRGPYKSVISHRRGFKKRPHCAQGRIWFVGPGTDFTVPCPDGYDPDRADPEARTAMPDEALRDPPPDPLAEPLPDEPDFAVEPVDGPNDLGSDDSEEIARRLLASTEDRGRFDDREGDEGSDNGFPELPPGDWRIEPPSALPHVSQDALSVSVPVVLKVYYDWMVGQGWRRGDGSLSAWVSDVVLCHMQVCMHKRIFVADIIEAQEAPVG